MSTRDSHRRRLMRERDDETVSRIEIIGTVALVGLMFLSAYFFGG